MRIIESLSLMILKTQPTTRPGAYTRLKRAHATAQLAKPTPRSAANDGVPALLRTSASAPRQKAMRAETPLTHARRNCSTMFASADATVDARCTSQRESGTPVGAVEKTAAMRDEPLRAAKATPNSTRIEIVKSDHTAASMPPRRRKRSITTGANGL